MDGFAVALVLSLAGNVVTAAERGTFLTLADCAAYAQAEAPGLNKIGAAIGCAQKLSDKSITITLYGRAPRFIRARPKGERR